MTSPSPTKAVTTLANGSSRPMRTVPGHWDRHRPDKRNGPGGKNAEHDYERHKMRGVKQKSPILVLPKDSQHNRIEKYQKGWTLRQQAKSEKNRCRNPNEPRRLLLSPKTQPKNDGKPAERNVEALDLDQAAFFNHADIRQPDQRCGH